MKFIYKNLEVIVCLIIIFFIFISLVLYYDNKIENIEKKCYTSNELYFNDSNDNYIINLLYKERISDSYIKVYDTTNDIESILYFDKSFIDQLVANKSYSIKLLRTSSQKFLKTQLQKIFDNNQIVEVKEEL